MKLSASWGHFGSRSGGLVARRNTHAQAQALEDGREMPRIDRMAVHGCRPTHSIQPRAVGTAGNSGWPTSAWSRRPTAALARASAASSCGPSRGGSGSDIRVISPGSMGLLLTSRRRRRRRAEAAPAPQPSAAHRRDRQGGPANGPAGSAQRRSAPQRPAVHIPRRRDCAAGRG